MKGRMFVGLTLLAVSATRPALSAKEKILVHRIGPSESTLFIAKADGSEERPLLPLVWRSENIPTLRAAQDGAADAPNQSTRHIPVVDELVQLMQARPDLRAALEGAIRTADLQGLRDMESFLIYLDGWVTFVPTEHELPTALKLYYIVDHAPGDQLNRDKSFSAWMKKLIEAWGQFLDTPASASGISSFAARPNYNISDYFMGPSGWLTFNQFFAREVKPGKRPIAEPHNEKVIVSPADSTFAGKWDIDANSKVTVKGVTWPLAQLLDGSPYQTVFEGGIFTHVFLRPDDYHRYHVPVAGEIKEVRNIHGRVYMDVIRGQDGALHGVDGETYQVDQERGLIVIDSPEVGLVAVLPVGMCFVSSVNLTPEVGARLQKGDEFGFFLFGGSDIVMLFQNKKVVIDAEVGRKYLQGQRIGEIRYLWGANPFVGTWKMNPAKSKYAADHPAPKSLTATIQEQPDGIVVDDAVGEDAKGNPIHAHYTARFDGKDYPLSGAADADTVNIKRIDENTIESTRKKKGQVITTIRSVVSADGKTRTSTWSGKDSKGNPETWTVVLDKQ